MRILVLTINYWPEQTGIGAVVTRRCEYLASIGHDVTVCTAMPYYPEWRIGPGYEHRKFVREARNGVTILRSWIWVPQTVTSAKRVLFEASFLATSLVSALGNRRPNLLIVVSPPLGLGLSAMFLKFFWKSPYVFDVEDLQPDAAADLGMLPGPLLPVLYRVEGAAYRNAKLITTASEGMRRKIIAKGISANKIVCLPAAAESSLFAIGDSGNGEEFREKYGLQNKLLVVHSGNMGVKQGLDVVLDAAVILRENPNIAFLLAGDGVMRSHLAERAAACNLSNVQFLPVVGQTEYQQMLSAIDIALVIQQSTVSDIAFPSKTVTLLSAARSVVASVSANSEVGRIIRQAGAGVVVEPERPEALAGTIRNLFDNPHKRSAMGECGRSYALQHWHETRILSAFGSNMLEAARTDIAHTLSEKPAH